MSMTQIWTMQLQLNKVETNVKSQLESRDLFPVVTYKIHFFAFIADVVVEDKQSEEDQSPEAEENQSPEAADPGEEQVTLTHLQSL